MFQAFAHLNWLALGLAALAYYVLGALWFTPLFGKLWDRAIGRAPSAERRFGLDYYIVPLASAILVSLALGVVLTILRPSSLGEATFVGVLIGFGVAFAVSVNNALTPHTPHPYLLGVVTGGYHLVGITGVSAIIGAFLV